MSSYDLEEFENLNYSKFFNIIKNKFYFIVNKITYLFH